VAQSDRLAGVSLVCAPTTIRPLCAVRPTARHRAGAGRHATTHVSLYAPSPHSSSCSVDLPVIGHVTPHSCRGPFAAFVLELRRDRSAALLLEPSAVAGAPTAEPGCLTTLCRPGSRSAYASARAASDRPHDAGLLDAPRLRRLALGLIAEILWRVLNLPPGTTVRHIGLAAQRLRPDPSIRWDSRPFYKRDTKSSSSRGSRR